MVSQPYEHAIDGADQMLEVPNFNVPQKLAALQRLARSSKSTQQVIVEHAKRFWRDCRVVALVHGNVTPGHAKEMTQSIWKALNDFRGKTTANGNKDDSDDFALAFAPPLERRVTQLNPGVSYLYRFEEYNPDDTNSCTHLLLQMGPLDLEDNAKLGFIHHLVKEPAFNQLRTEEQLGYIVHSSIKTSGHNIKSLLFLIQSEGFDPIHVEERIEAFLVRFRSRIQNMSKEEFETNVNAVVASYLEKVSRLLVVESWIPVLFLSRTDRDNTTLSFSLSIEQKPWRGKYALLGRDDEKKLSLSTIARTGRSCQNSHKGKGVTIL